MLKPGRPHNKRLHTDATALSTYLLAVASRLRWPSEVDQGGAGEPQSVLRLGARVDMALARPESNCIRLTPRLLEPAGAETQGDFRLSSRRASGGGSCLLAPLRSEAHQTSWITEGVVSCRGG